MANALGSRVSKDTDFRGMTNAQILGEICRKSLWGSPGSGKRSLLSGTENCYAAIAQGYV